MHESSHETMRAFVRVHLDAHRGSPLEVLDFGSQVVDDQPLSYVGLFDDPAWRYRGLDIEAGSNVDLVVEDAYAWEAVPSDSVDLVISGQAFEHVEYFWASMFEIVRVIKPGGLAAIVAPAGGFEHRYPVDCWRFYPDGFRALARYVDCELVDVFTDWGHGEWDDSILVARKPVDDADWRMRFAVRSTLQRRLLEPGWSEHESGIAVPDVIAEPSVLAAAVPGALTAELERMRAERLDREAAEAAQAAQASWEAEQEAHRAVAAEAERIAAERLQQITPVRWYGRVRSAVAGVVGERGRSLYRRLRGRG